MRAPRQRHGILSSGGLRETSDFGWGSAHRFSAAILARLRAQGDRVRGWPTLDYRFKPPYNLPMATEPLTIERLSAPEGPRVLCLRGPLTFENLSLFQNAIRREENFPMVILDLSDVPYIDSAGLGSLVSAYVRRHKATQHIALSGVNDRVLKLFETTRVEPLFLMFPTLEDAITALTGAAEA